jgi:hypothetical protein
MLLLAINVENPASVATSKVYVSVAGGPVRATFFTVNVGRFCWKESERGCTITGGLITNCGPTVKLDDLDTTLVVSPAVVFTRQ